MRRRVPQIAEGGEIGDDGDPADPAGEIFKANRPRHPEVGMTKRRKSGETQVGDRHQDQADHHRPLHPHPGIEHATNKNPDQISLEANADVIDRHFIIGETKIFEQQPHGQLTKRVSDLVQQNEQQDECRAAPLEEFGQGSPD